MGGVMCGDPNDPQEALATAELFQGEWCNGGFAQFLSNWDSEDAASVPEALRTIGFPQGAGIVDKVIIAAGPPKDWQDVGHRAMMDHALPIARCLNDLNRDFGELEEIFDKTVVDFEYRLAKASGEDMFE